MILDIQRPNIERLLADLHRERLDRVPNFEICINARNLSHLLGREVDGDSSLWSISAADCVQVAEAVAQDAVPCPLHFGLSQGSIIEHPELVLIGNIDVQSTLSFGTQKDVRILGLPLHSV